jgi:hypothetical protein
MTDLGAFRDVFPEFSKTSPDHHSPVTELDYPSLKSISGERKRMLCTIRILLLNPDVQIVYLVIGKGFHIRSPVPSQTALKLLEEENIDLILLQSAVPLPTDEQDGDELDQAA